MSVAGRDSERQPLLREQTDQSQATQGSRIDEQDGKKIIRFADGDSEHPRNWSNYRKMSNVMVIASMAIMSPLASAAFTPAISSVSKDLGVEPTAVVTATTGFVVMLGVGPLILAPLSETFGRRILYLICFGIFTILQSPTALSPGLPTFLVARTLAGFFGSVGIANGGGTISDMYTPSERAGVFGVYLLGPLLGPALGPLLGGVVNEFISWRWIFWITGILSLITWVAAIFFLKESYAPIVLSQRKQKIEQEKHAEPGEYTFEGEDTRPLYT